MEEAERKISDTFSEFIVDVYGKLARKRDDIIRRIFAECGYCSKEDFEELMYYGRVIVLRETDYFNYNFKIEYYKYKIDGDDLFLLRECRQFDPDTHLLNVSWDYEIYKKKGE